MTPPVSIASIMGIFFPKSEKVLSEKLATEEHSALALEAGELHTQLQAAIDAKGLAETQLATANATITALNTSLETEKTQVASLNGQLATVTTERDAFKAQHEKIASKGDQNPNEDVNSRKVIPTSNYNQMALDAFHKVNA